MHGFNFNLTEPHAKGDVAVYSSKLINPPLSMATSP